MKPEWATGAGAMSSAASSACSMLSTFCRTLIHAPSCPHFSAESSSRSASDPVGKGWASNASSALGGFQTDFVPMGLRPPRGSRGEEPVRRDLSDSLCHCSRPLYGTSLRPRLTDSSLSISEGCTGRLYSPHDRRRDPGRRKVDSIRIPSSSGAENGALDCS